MSSDKPARQVHQRPRTRAHGILPALVVIASFCGGLQARPPTESRGAMALDGVIGMREAYLSPRFWIGRIRHPDRVLMRPAQIALQNDRMQHMDPSMHAIRDLPASLAREQVAAWIEHTAQRPSSPLLDASGTAVTPMALEGIIDNRAVEAIPARRPTRFGLVVRRAALRAFPTDQRVFNAAGDVDIDRFQETALFPGTPVAIAHESRDGEWWFVLSPRYAAWIRKQAVAEASKAAVFDFVDRSPYRVVTGATAHTAFTPEAARVSRVQLDMGVRMPIWTPPAGQPVNGQNPYSSWTIGLPVRNDDGSLAIAPALLPRNADTRPTDLPLTRGNIIGQAFKFLGERYGWGDDYDARDCSGFVSEVYGSMGIELPRNTGDQARSPALDRVHLGADAGRDARMAALRALDVGDLIYLPGHVMLVIGRIGDEPYVIHDIHGGTYLGTDGRLHSMHLNAVSVTPLTPLRFDTGQRFVERMTDIVRIRAAAPGGTR